MRFGSTMDNAPIRFEPANGLRYVDISGWRPLEIENLVAQARQVPAGTLVRVAVSFLSQDPREAGRSFWSSVVGFLYR
ncbi:hypothetical protein AB0M34_33225 [Nocardia sp. NPDC050193]